MLRSFVLSQTIYVRALLKQPSHSISARNMSTSTPPTLSPLVHHLRPGPPAADAQTTAHRLLLANHSDYDIFEANQIFHNHLSHHVLTAFALGAPSSLLEKIFQHEKQTLVPLDPAERKAQLEKKGRKVRTDVPELDSANWTEFAGVQDAYARYLSFFSQEIKSHGRAETIAQRLFSPEANSGGVSNKTGPRMLIRLVGGVIHPFIQLGFGAEFDYDVVLAEGLAETAVHSADTIGGLFPPSWPYPPIDDPLACFSLSPAPPASWGPPKTALEVYRDFVVDSDVVVKPYDPDKMINTRLQDSIESGNASRLQSFTKSWMSSAPPNEGTSVLESNAWVAKKVEEVQVLNAFLACGTGRLGRETRIDFFLMHLLTSSLFLPAIMPLLPTFAHKKTLLATYFLAVLHTSLARGRPTIDARVPLSWPSKEAAPADNPFGDWQKIIDKSLGHPDSHTIKTQRALRHISGLLNAGDYPPGAIDPEGHETFPGMKDVDKEIFVKMAGEVGRYMGWTQGGGDWDRTALGWNAAWE